VLKQGWVQRVILSQKTGSPFEIDRVPERDGRDNQVQPAGSMGGHHTKRQKSYAKAVVSDNPTFRARVFSAWDGVAKSALFVFPAACLHALI
jgi:hypothetical protein